MSLFDEYGDEILMKCPSCGKLLSEVGYLINKEIEGYRVYDSVINTREFNGNHRVVECLECERFAYIDRWGRGK